MKFKDKLKAVKNLSLKNVNLKKITEHVETVDEIKEQNKLIILNQKIIIKLLSKIEKGDTNDKEETKQLKN